MSGEDRKYAWAHFAAAAFQRNPRAAVSAAEADKLLAEFDARFGPCALCKGRGHAAGSNDDCPQCHGTGEKKP